MLVISSCSKDDDGDNAPSGVKAVDLGLSVKWASCNIGATSPEQFGNYFAWGETEPKSFYGWGTYKYCNGSDDTMTKYCTYSRVGTVDNKTTLDLSDDAAHVNWGGSWRMPTYAEQEELMNCCRWETRSYYNGARGCIVTGPSGNSIFLPETGFYDYSELKYANQQGYYWSSTCSGGDDAEYLYCGSSYGYDGKYRYRGFCVRAVCP